MSLIVDPRKPRQLRKNEPWFFWRQPVPDGPREGLVVATFACTVPECDCREVKLEARLVDDSLRSVELADDRLVFEFENGTGSGAGGPHDGTKVLRAALDIDSGELLITEEEWHEDLSEWLLDEVDGELLDRLQDGWLATKGLPGVCSPSNAAILATRTGEMVPWQDVFPMARQDAYVAEEGYFEVIDAHCIAPGCRCKHAAVQILQGDDLVANVLYDYGHGRIESEERIAIAKDTLDAVWTMYRRRYRVSPRLAAHAEQVQNQAAQIRREASRTSAEKSAGKVGRNAPCPCGSGKKYKQCCLKR